MPLDQIGTPCSYVGLISFKCYLSLVLEALWGTYKLTNLSLTITLKWPLVN